MAEPTPIAQSSFVDGECQRRSARAANATDSPIGSAVEMSEFENTTAGRNERYRLVEDSAMRRAERRVTGCDYGATSYTTRFQADRMARRLELKPGRLFLDFGSGAGWPGIYLAASTGARVVLTDIPQEGLLVASRRLRRDRVTGHIVLATGEHLPFRDESFDAVTSSDVLC